MRRFHILLALSSALVCLLPGCTAHRYPQALLQADSLSEVRPDSSMLMLEAMKDQMDAAPEADRMYYRLLRIKAADKADKMVPDTSEVAQLLTYYESAKDSLLPTAYYYAGRTYYDLNNMPQALHYFQKAVDEIEAIRKKSRKYIELEEVCYSQMGYAFAYNKLYDEAQVMFTESINCAEIINDTLGLAYGYRDLATTYEGHYNYEEALKCQKKAMDLIRHTDALDVMLSINAYTAACYRHIGKIDSALAYIRPVIEADLLPKTAVYSNAAKIYYRKGVMDSALYYFHQIESVGNVYAKANTYKYLLENSVENKNLADVIKYYNKYILYDDSLKQITQTENIARSFSAYNLQKIESRNRELEMNNTLRLTIIIIIVLISIIIITIFYTILQDYKRKHVIQVENYQTLERAKEADYKKSVEYIKANEKKIKELEAKLYSLNEDNTELKKQLERERQRLISSNQLAEIGLNMKEQTLINIKDSNIYRKLMGMPQNEHPTDEDWKDLEYLLNSECDNFCNKLKSIYKLSVIQYRISLLIKIGIDPVRMAFMLNTSKQNISTIRMRLYQVVFGKKGRAKDWDAYIKSL